MVPRLRRSKSGFVRGKSVLELWWTPTFAQFPTEAAHVTGVPSRSTGRPLQFSLTYQQSTVEAQSE
jgi:hypothetical protein